MAYFLLYMMEIRHKLIENWEYAMIKSKNIYILLPLTLFCMILLVLLRHMLQTSLADVSLFAQYTSPMEKDLAIITKIMEGSMDPPTEGKRLFYTFVIGGIFSVSLSYLFIYLTRRKEISSLYFTLAGIFLGIRLAFTKEALLMNLLFDFSPEATMHGDLIAGVFALFFFLLFYSMEFINRAYRKYMKILIWMLVIYSIILFVFPVQILIQTFFIYQILGLSTMVYIILFTVITVIENKRASNINLLGFLILFILSWNDILHYSDTISTNDFIMIGTFIYFILLAIHLANRVSSSFVRIEKLTEELLYLNTSLERKVEQRTEQLLNANLALKEEEEARRRLLTNVSHELNTPLAFIQGYVKAMMDDVLPKEDTSYLRAIYDDTKMMSYMINDLQELSIIELGHVTFQLEEVNIRTYMQQLFEENEPVFKDKNIKFLYKENQGTDVYSKNADIDPVRIKQVVTNLIMNAQKFTSAEGIITLEVSLKSEGTNDVAVISVIDTGRGIKDTDLPYVFERLFKVDSSQKHVKKGSGLGLAIVKEIIAFHGGKVGVKSVFGVGSTFYFTLPLKGENENVKGESINR